MTRVLLVEDHPALRAALDEALGVFGFDVVSVSTVDAARGQLVASDVDVVVTDLGVPGEGHTMLDAEVPVIVLTADPEPGLREEMLARGAVDALTKPVSGSELRRVIDRTLAGERDR